MDFICERGFTLTFHKPNCDVLMTLTMYIDSWDLVFFLLIIQLIKEKIHSLSETQHFSVRHCHTVSLDQCSLDSWLAWTQVITL